MEFIYKVKSEFDKFLWKIWKNQKFMPKWTFFIWIFRNVPKAISTEIWDWNWDFVNQNHCFIWPIGADEQYWTWYSLALRAQRQIFCVFMCKYVTGWTTVCRECILDVLFRSFHTQKKSSCTRANTSPIMHNIMNFLFSHCPTLYVYIYRSLWCSSRCRNKICNQGIFCWCTK